MSFRFFDEEDETMKDANLNNNNNNNVTTTTTNTSTTIINPSKLIDVHDQMIVHYRNLIQTGELKVIDLPGQQRTIKRIQDVPIKYTTQLLDQQASNLRNNDLIPQIYEGGFKLWECSTDLVGYLFSNFTSLKGTLVLELGCGHALPGIAAMSLGATVHFQDYNQEVVEQLTVANVIANFGMVPTGSLFYSGDWADFPLLIGNNFSFDLILTADTLYSIASYERLINVFRKCLKVGGIVLIATKVFYFGVGGGVTEFLNVLERICPGCFEVSTVARMENGISNTRTILKLSRLS